MGILEDFGALDDGDLEDGNLEDFSLLDLGCLVDLEVFSGLVDFDLRVDGDLEGFSSVGCLVDFDS